MLTFNLAQRESEFHDLAGLSTTFTNLGDENLRRQFSQLKEADEKLFRQLVDLYCEMGKTDLSRAPHYSYTQQVPFIDMLIVANCLHDSYRIVELANTLARIRDLHPTLKAIELRCGQLLWSKSQQAAERLGV
jgi:hypothetical protein